jgi:hypothetical protein
MINYDSIAKSLESFGKNPPFDYCVVENFFDDTFARKLSSEFLDYESDKWHFYDNAIENKKTLNDWNIFPKDTYHTFNELYSEKLIDMLSKAVGKKLYPDNGLHGGGWHIHGSGGNLNPHLDYSIHPKLGLERKLNIIIYLSTELIPEQHGGHLGLWSNDEDKNSIGELIIEVPPTFNTAVIFDTTQDSWHGMSRILSQPEGIYRKSLAIYYLCEPSEDASNRGRALFAPRKNQEGDAEIEDLIRKRSDVNASLGVYRTKK